MLMLQCWHAFEFVMKIDLQQNDDSVRKCNRVCDPCHSPALIWGDYFRGVILTVQIDWITVCHTVATSVLFCASETCWCFLIPCIVTRVLVRAETERNPEDKVLHLNYWHSTSRERERPCIFAIYGNCHILSCWASADSSLSALATLGAPNVKQATAGFSFSFSVN